MHMLVMMQLWRSAAGIGQHPSCAWATQVAQVMLFWMALFWQVAFIPHMQIMLTTLWPQWP